MTFSNAVKTCFRKYVTFSGRASRSEYWYFFLFLFLASICLGLVDRAIFGTRIVESTSTDTSIQVSGSSDGPIASVFTLLTLLPALAAGWRRMHDTGKSGFFLLYPLIVFVGIATFASFTGLLDGGDLTTLSAFMTAVLAFSVIVFFISPLLVLWWLTRASIPGTNPYGPNPHEVPS